MMYAKAPGVELQPQLPYAKRSMFQRIGAWGDANVPTGPVRTDYNPSADPGFKFNVMGDPTAVKQGQPLRNDTSATSAAVKPQPEIDTSPEQWVNPDQPPESQGMASRSAQEQLSPLSGIEKQIADLQAQLTDNNNFQINKANAKPSLGRRVLGTAAGIGLGALTMNPQVGLNARESILDQPLMDEQKRVAMERAPYDERLAGLYKLGGLTQQGMQRTAELGQASAAQAQATNKTNEEQRLGNEVTPINYGTGKPGESQEGVVRKFGGVNQVPRPVGAPKVAKQTQDQVQLVKNSDGKYYAVDKEHPDKPIEVPGVIDAPTKQAFDSYWNALPPKGRTAEAAVRWQQAGAAQVGANYKSEEQRKAARASDAAHVAGEIFSRVQEKDPSKAREAATQKLNALVQQSGNELISDGGDTTIASAAKEIQAEIDKRYAGFNKSQKGRATVILPKGSNGNVTINNGK